MSRFEAVQGNKPQNLYIHIPFCESKCHYCNFVSFAGENGFIAPYFSALKKEIGLYTDKYSDLELQTIYIGGGTPSIADIKHYEEIFEILRKAQNAEITMEINPGTVDLNYLKTLKSLGINRLSIGVQSFDDKILKLINRIHNKKEALETVKTAQNTGFENISIDLIYGLPFQTAENWKETLNQALNLDIQHISTYGLKIEDGTEFAKNLPENLPDEEAQSEIYLKIIEILEDNSFYHYEISNFSKRNFESQHNLCYWKNREYLGVGLSAHGYLDGIRYSNTENFEEYLSNPLKRASENKISEKERIEEAIFLGLRLIQGINTEEFKALYNVDILQKYSKIIEKYIDYGFMIFENGYLKLTPQGILLSNSILADFLE